MVSGHRQHSSIHQSDILAIRPLLLCPTDNVNILGGRKDMIRNEPSCVSVGHDDKKMKFPACTPEINHVSLPLRLVRVVDLQNPVRPTLLEDH